MRRLVRWNSRSDSICWATYRSAIDGKQGPLTKRALRAFQQNHNLDVTGEVDEKTLSRLMGYMSRE
jgi:peptidoglycan hydrolase-like protein with peptidoglycan-binding domain